LFFDVRIEEVKIKRAVIAVEVIIFEIEVAVEGQAMRGQQIMGFVAGDLPYAYDEGDGLRVEKPGDEKEKRRQEGRGKAELSHNPIVIVKV
jgi:hypothetical protein